MYSFILKLAQEFADKLPEEVPAAEVPAEELPKAELTIDKIIEIANSSNQSVWSEIFVNLFDKFFGLGILRKIIPEINNIQFIIKFIEQLDATSLKKNIDNYSYWAVLELMVIYWATQFNIIDILVNNVVKADDELIIERFITLASKYKLLSDNHYLKLFH